jgi:hypothetical protein
VGLTRKKIVEIKFFSTFCAKSILFILPKILKQAIYFLNFEFYMILKLLPNNLDETFFIFNVVKTILRRVNHLGICLTVYCSDDFD